MFESLAGAPFKSTKKHYNNGRPSTAGQSELPLGTRSSAKFETQDASSVGRCVARIKPDAD